MRTVDGAFVASDDIFDVCGSGDSLAAAVGDYLAALVKLFEIMDEAPEEQSRRMLEDRKLYVRNA